MIILFPSSPIEPKKVDPSFEKEYAAAVKAGFKVVVADINEETGKPDRSLPDGADKYIYRGWMLKPDVYRELCVWVNMYTDPVAYRRCHEFGWYRLILSHTPRSIKTPKENALDDDVLQDVLDDFGEYGVVVKGLTKSLKHRWDDAMYVPAGATKEQLKKVVTNYLADPDSSDKVLFRRYMPIKEIDGVKQEYRLFFWKKKLLISCPYWEGQVEAELPQAALEAASYLAEGIPSPFFTMDIARLADDGWTVIEIGDGGVSGLQQIEPDTFYKALKESL